MLRSIFRICYERFIEYADNATHIGGVSLEIHAGPDRRGTWGMKEEEYMADFLSVARRTLSESDHRIFRYRFILGADWRLCARKTNIDRGAYFHAVYRIQQQLGRAFAELEPYPLFPLSEYFQTTFRSQRVTALPRIDTRVPPLRPPLLPSPELQAA